MALSSTPEYQQAMQRFRAKASMRGQRNPNTTGLISQLHQQDMARKQAFGSLARSKQRSDLSHRGRMSQYNLQRSALEERKSQLPWQIAIGGGTALWSALEGRRRAGMIKSEQERVQQRHEDRMRMHEQQNRSRRYR